LFFFFIVTAGISSIILAILHPNNFLLIFGIFTICLVGTDYRYMRLRLLGKGQKPAITDRFLSLGMLLSGICFVAWGSYMIYNSANFGRVLVSFGLIGLNNVRSDFKNYAGRSKKKKYWMLVHIGRMMGGYTASLTAFIVVNAQYYPFEVPSLVIWLGPAVLLTPFSIYWSKPYK
tara:strand:+ start:3224 stop:3748 length:525 start_codon:yes stop_codon:yes gene_type:complete